MLVEVHILQNFALSNLNRDDTGAPKDCEFGGYRRARISSQCIKRSVRTYFNEHSQISRRNLAVRTRHLAQELTRRLVDSGGRDKEASAKVAQAGLEALSLKLKDGKTEYLLFVGHREIDKLVETVLRHWDVLQAGDTRSPQYKQAQEDLLACLDGGEAVDLALFGRMVANRPEKNVDAATQVAHAISTNRVSVEFDFYTAVEDLPEFEPEAGAGAGMMGTVQYNSSCYYRYANIDLRQLLTNLGGDTDLARSAVRAFLEAFILAVPSGKQNATAAQNPPSFVLAVVRDRGLCSLVNAFVQPVRPDHNGDLVRKSIEALVGYWSRLLQVYGDDDIRYQGALSVDDVELEGIRRVAGMRALLDEVTDHIEFGDN